jgi:hypothetical protein
LTESEKKNSLCELCDLSERSEAPHGGTGWAVNQFLKSALICACWSAAEIYPPLEDPAIGALPVVAKRTSRHRGPMELSFGCYSIGVRDINYDLEIAGSVVIKCFKVLDSFQKRWMGVV